MSASLSSLIPELQPAARALVNAAGAARLAPRITSTLRTRAEQERLYRRFQQGLQPLPVAPPGTSAHEYGYAFDMVVSPMDALTDVGATWESWGGVWGGEFNDPVHFEYPGFIAPRGAGGGYDTSLVNQAVTALANLPWYVSMFLPVELTVRPVNVNMEEWAARVMTWIRENT